MTDPSPDPPRPSPAAAALEYKRYGMQPVLLHWRDKIPVFNEWQKQNLTENNIPELFTNKNNIGLQLGPASGGLIDIDIDSPTALALAPQFLPPTNSVYGRKSKLNSHWMYRCPELFDGEYGGIINIKDGNGHEVASLRIGASGKGAQSMVPPSIHPSGELVEWKEGYDLDPQVYNLDIVWTFRALCITSILADNWPPHAGSRNEIAMAVAGWLAMAEVHTDWAQQIIKTAAIQAGDDEIRSRVRCVEDTYKKYGRGEKVKGWTSLSQLIDGKAAKSLRTALANRSKFRELTKDGAPQPKSRFNVMDALDHLELECSYDEFSMRNFIVGHALAECSGELSDHTLFRLGELMFDRFRLTPAIPTILEAVKTKCGTNRFHPVLDYLAKLIWDGVPRIDRWLVDYGGATDTPFNCAVGGLVLMAAVRRVRSPGCKFDETLVLEGAEGINKSSALQVLAVKSEWFSDSLSFNQPARETIEQTVGRWIIEIPELRGLKRSDFDKRKAFQSRQEDHARMAYGYVTSNVPRQWISIGTTNESKYLEDLTGNRRFWPVAVAGFDLEALGRDRDQLWAEAAEREAAGESIRLSEDLWPEATKQQVRRVVENPYISRLELGLCEEDGTPMQGKILKDDIWALLDLPSDRRNYTNTIALITSAMQELGWENDRLRFGKGRDTNPLQCYSRGEQPYRTIAVRPRAMQDGEVIPAYAYYVEEDPEDDDRPEF